MVIVTTPTPSTNAPPTILGPSPLPLPHDVIYASPESPASLNLTVSDPNTLLGMYLDPVTPLPPGARIEGPMAWGQGSVEFRFLWEEPSEDEVGSHILCFTARDSYQAKSPPTCLVVVVTRQFEQVHEILAEPPQ